MKRDKLDVTVRYLIPLKDLIVRDPTTKEPLPEEGGVRPWIGAEGRYWRRRAKDGSVTVLAYQPSVSNSESEKETETKRGRSK